MEKETKEYLERKWLTLAQKDDLEKLRQETKVNFRQIKEENKTQILEWKEEARNTLGQLGREWIGAIDSLRSEINGRLEKLKEDVDIALDRLTKETLLQFQAMKEDGKRDIAASLVSSREEIKGEVGRLREGLGAVDNLATKMTGEISALNGKIEEGFTGVKEELGAMLEFSSADLKKRIDALEAKVKALEKRVGP